MYLVFASIALASLVCIIAFSLFQHRRLGKHGSPIETCSFIEGDYAHYNKADGQPSLLIQICKIHLDDEMVPYYTIRLPDGSERQTVCRYLSSHVDVDNNEEKPVRVFQRLISIPCIAFWFSSSTDVIICALKEAAGEAFADLDFVHSLPSLGPWPGRLGFLWLVGFLLRSDSLMRVALVGIKLFAVYYTLRLPYTCLTHPYDSPRLSQRKPWRFFFFLKRNIAS